MRAKARSVTERLAGWAISVEVVAALLIAILSPLRGTR
jgi:hypothetical protein